MGVDIIAKGVRSNKTDGSGIYRPVVNNGLVGAFFQNKTLMKASRNYAIDMEFGSVVGTPVASSTSTKFKGLVNYISTDIKETAEMTIFLVAKTTELMASGNNADAPYFVGTHAGVSADGVANNGISLFFDASTRTLRAGATFTNGTTRSFNTAILPKKDSDDIFRLYKAKFTNSSITITDTTSNVTIKQAIDGSTRSVNLGLFKIGSATKTWGGACDIAVVMIYNRATLDSEDLLIESSIKNYVKSLGIIV